jgi:carboxymethylenebutenolidase
MPLSENSAARGENIVLTSSDGTHFIAYLATPGATPNAQVVILPDVRGLHNFYRELALRFADVGMRALAMDYFGRTAQTDVRDDSFVPQEHRQHMTPETFRQDLAAAVAYTRRKEGQGLPTFTVGFCMGGALSFWAGTRGLQLAGVIGFYGALTRTFGAETPVLDWADRIESPVLGLFGGADEAIPPEEIAEFERKLEAARVEHEIVVYPGAPHSFFDRRATDFAQASADAWTRIQGFIAGHQLTRVY